MSYIKPEDILRAKKIDLYTYLKYNEPQELVHISGDNYTTRTHDSLKIHNGKWMWWSRGIGGHTALDYLIKVRGYTFVEAVKTLLGNGVILPTDYCVKKKTSPKNIRMPQKFRTNKVITDYLLNRGIDIEIIDYCIRTGKIFESIPYHNLVFVGFDETKKPRYGAYRATNERKLLGDLSGSDKRYSFRLEGVDKSTLHLFECPIDTLSYATLIRMSGGDYLKHTLLSLGGVYARDDNVKESKLPIALTMYLEKHPEVKRIELHFDNDKIGRRASESVIYKLSHKYEIVDSPPPFGKDFNDFLRSHLRKNKDIVRSFER